MVNRRSRWQPDRPPCHQRPHQDHGRINVTFSQSWLLLVTRRIRRLYGGAFFKSSCQVTHSIPYGLVKIFTCIYNYTFTFLPGHPETWDWIASMGCPESPVPLLKLISTSTGASFCFFFLLSIAVLTHV